MKTTRAIHFLYEVRVERCPQHVSKAWGLYYFLFVFFFVKNCNQAESLLIKPPPRESLSYKRYSSHRHVLFHRNDVIAKESSSHIIPAMPSMSQPNETAHNGTLEDVLVSNVINGTELEESDVSEESSSSLVKKNYLTWMLGGQMRGSRRWQRPFRFKKGERSSKDDVRFDISNRRDQSIHRNETIEVFKKSVLNATAIDPALNATNHNSESDVDNESLSTKDKVNEIQETSVVHVNETTWKRQYKNSKIVSSKTRKKSSSKKSNSTSLVTSLPNDSFLTVKDLEIILRSNEFIRRDDLEESIRQEGFFKKQQASQLAFPQSSEVTKQSIIFGSTISASILSALIGITIYPGLWLVGLVLGTNFGYRISSANSIESSFNLFEKLVLAVGERVAVIYLKIYDFWQGMWYLYKTGQLSYDYMKQYQAIDEKYRIQAKIDAWNARFQQGKKDFDKWEKDNEVGRKVLAGLRTVWLIEENSFKRTTKKKTVKRKYRVVEFTKKVCNWLGLLAFAIWDAVTGAGISKLNDLANGVKMSVLELNFEESAKMLGGGFMALFAINLAVAAFEVSPKALSFTAFFAGSLFPEWIQDMYQNIRNLVVGTTGKSLAEKRSHQISKEATKQPRKPDTITGVSGVFGKIQNFQMPQFDKAVTKKRRDFSLPTISFPKRKKKREVWGGIYKRR